MAQIIQDGFYGYIVKQLSEAEKKLGEIQDREQQLGQNEQLKFTEEKKQILDQMLLFTQMKQHYLEYQQQQGGSSQQLLCKTLSQTLFLGPIALNKPSLLRQQQKKNTYDTISNIRKVYETILGSSEIFENTNQKFAYDFQNQISGYLLDILGDRNYHDTIDSLYSNQQIQQLSKDSWIQLLGQVIDLPTIQELRYTQVDFEFGEQHQRSNESDSKIQFNYDGDEEKTPYQSEQEEKKEIVKYQKKKQDTQKDANKVEDEAGYDASNSDRSLNKTSKNRVNRNIQRKIFQNNIDPGFDTDKDKK